MSENDTSDIDAQIAASIKKFSGLAKEGGVSADDIIDMPDFVRTKAQLISAHMLLMDGAKVVDMGCARGEITYMMAALNPRAEFIGIDTDESALDFARETYKLPNLSFQKSDFSLPDFEEESLDGIVNSNVLHHVYSDANFDPHAVTALLEQQVAKLKSGGMMLVRDYMMPPDDEFVLLELPDVPSRGSSYADMSPADLLVSFSQTARPMEMGCEGFFIEEVNPLNLKTKLFRLPHKWAKEFIHRKDYTDNWEEELSIEYTFFTWKDYRREFTKLGMRMAFSAPYWNPWVVKNSYQGRFQLYDEDTRPMSPPPTNYFVVSQKVADRQSLILEERRPSQQPVGDLEIIVVRDQKTGHLHELVKRPGEYCDIVPYRMTADNRVVVYVRSGYPRPLVNAVPRGCRNLDGKKWSGHLIESITMDTVNMTDDIDENRQMIFDYIESYTGLRPKDDEAWYVGETYFPSPDRIDEAIEPVFVEVENPYKTNWPIGKDDEVAFTEVGLITELDVTEIILAAQVGLLPDPRLELHVFDLMGRYGITFPRWISEVMPKMLGDPVKPVDPEELLKEIPASKFSEVDQKPVHLKAVKSVFVEEGRVGRSTRGLSSQDVEFIVTDDGIENIALVIPVSRDWDDNLLVALEPQVMPVPNRLGGDGVMLNAPSFVLPPDVRTIHDAKAFVAKTFKVPPEQVAQLGESYFTHTGVTPQRVYPFVVAAEGDAGQGPLSRYTSLNALWRHLGFSRYGGQLFKALARVHMMVAATHDMAVHRSPLNLRRNDMKLSTEKTAVEKKNAGYSAVPSRVLGQRGAAAGGGGGNPSVPSDDYLERQQKREMDAAITLRKKVLLEKENSAARAFIGKTVKAKIKNSASHIRNAFLEKINITKDIEVEQIEREIQDVADVLKDPKKHPFYIAGPKLTPPQPTAPKPDSESESPKPDTKGYDGGKGF